MSEAFYRLVLGLSRTLGLWVVAAAAWFISTLFFVFGRSMVKASVGFYRALFPKRGCLHALVCTWRQFHSFARLYAERLLLERPGAIHSESRGWENLTRTAEQGKGGIILMSHLGTWEIAGRLLRRRGLKLLLYMGAARQEQIHRMQQTDAEQDGVRILATSEIRDSLLDGLEGLSFLREGGFVSLAGDRTLSQETQTVTVSFLGHALRLPLAPYTLALLSGAPLHTFFAVRVGRRRYRIEASGPIPVVARGRAERAGAIQRAAQAYADRLEAMVRRHPEQWYTFEPVLGPPMEPAKTAPGRRSRQ